MPTTAQEDIIKANDYFAARTEDWTEYRNRAHAEGQKYVAAIEDILDDVRAGRQVFRKGGPCPG